MMTCEVPFEVADTDDMEDPYKTCDYGYHDWRYMGEDWWVCRECGPTDPEGDQAR